jgi:type IV secretory pathway TraG/TraD family ATPase VirD4
MLSRNIYSTRKDPILAFLDEIPRIKIPKLSDLMNIARSNGGCFFLGAQGIDLMEGTFGAKETGSILDACKTQAIGQLVGGRSSNFYSEKIFGKEDVRVRNTNRNHGHKNKSRGDSENTQTRPLVEAQTLQQLPQGDFFFLSPSVGNHRNVRIPFRHSVRIPDREIQQMQMGKDWWRDSREERIANSKAKPLTDAQLLAREYLANDLFPSVQSQVQAQDYADGVDSLLTTALAEH